MASYEWPPNGGGSVVSGNLTDTGTDGITIGNGTNAVLGSGTTIAQHVADATHNGYLSSTDWSTFNNKEPAVTKGNLTDTGTDGITIGNGTGAVIGSGTTISQHVADTTHNGYLSSTDWNTFNGKQSALTFTSPLINTTGTVALQGASNTAFVGSGGTGATTLAYTSASTASTLVVRDSSSNFSAGTITASLSGNATSATSATTATNATNVAITDDTTTNATMYPLWVTTASSNQAVKVSSTKLTFNPSTAALTTTTFVGALTGTASGNTTYSASNHGVVISSATNAMTVISPDASTAKFLRSGGSNADPTWNQVTLTSDVTGTLPIANGGTNNGSLVVTGGTVYYGDGSKLVGLANGSAGQVLTSSGTTVAPTWATSPSKDCWSGFHASDSSFARTGTTIAAFSADSTSTFTEVANSNFGTVTSQVSGSDKLPGIVFTPSAAGYYLVHAVAQTFGPATNAVAQTLNLVETGGSTLIATAAYQTNGTGQTVTQLTMIGIYHSTDANSKTIAIQGASGSGTITLTASNSLSHTIDWSITRI